MKPEPVVRPGTCDDHAGALRCINEAFLQVAAQFGFTREANPGHPAYWRPERFAEALTTDGNLLIAESGEVIGCVFVGPLASKPGLWVLKRLSVRPDAGGLGVGSLLLESAVADAFTAGADQVSLRIVSANLPLASWYERRGFARTAEFSLPQLGFDVAEYRRGFVSHRVG